jgi:hypothetical protein
MSIALRRMRSATSLLTTLHRHTSFRRTISSANGAPATKFLETFNEEFEIGNRIINLETGKIARLTNGAVVLTMEDTKILSTVSCSKDDTARADFLPLTVTYSFYSLSFIHNRFCFNLASFSYTLLLLASSFLNEIAIIYS